jgi:hypothetical protein
LAWLVSNNCDIGSKSDQLVILGVQER